MGRRQTWGGAFFQGGPRGLEHDAVSTEKGDEVPFEKSQVHADQRRGRHSQSENGQKTTPALDVLRGNPFALPPEVAAGAHGNWDGVAHLRGPFLLSS